jgi:hypothetical protein
MTHDWLFVGRHCLVDGEAGTRYDQIRDLNFDDSATILAEAYVVLPRAVRIGLRILQRGRVPSYTITGDGLPGDPVNLVLIGKKSQLRSAFAAAGWSEADALGLSSSSRMVRRLLSARSTSSAEARTSASSNQLATVLANGITFAFGHYPSNAPSRPSTRHPSGSTRFDRPTTNACFGSELVQRTLAFR